MDKKISVFISGIIVILVCVLLDWNSIITMFTGLPCCEIVRLVAFLFFGVICLTLFTVIYINSKGKDL